MARNVHSRTDAARLGSEPQHERADLPALADREGVLGDLERVICDAWGRSTYHLPPSRSSPKNWPHVLQRRSRKTLATRKSPWTTRRTHRRGGPFAELFTAQQPSPKVVNFQRGIVDEMAEALV